MFSHTSASGKLLLIMYVDDIIITGDDKKGIDDLKRCFKTPFKLRVWANFVISWVLR